MQTVRDTEWEVQLVKKAAQGDESAFAQLVDIYRPTLTSMAMRLLRNPEDAQDAVQEAFVKAFRALKDFDHNRPLKPWLCRICSNCCVDTVRSRH